MIAKHFYTVYSLIICQTRFVEPSVSVLLKQLNKLLFVFTLFSLLPFKYVNLCSTFSSSLLFDTSRNILVETLQFYHWLPRTGFKILSCHIIHALLIGALWSKSKQQRLRYETFMDQTLKTLNPTFPTMQAIPPFCKILIFLAGSHVFRTQDYL